MASYTIEDIELIRKKSGISYQEAVALLDYHNGNVARALVDLERNGRIKNESSQTKQEQTASSHKGRSGLASFFSRLYQFRLKVKKENIIIANVSLLFALLALLISPHLLIAAAIIILVLGYKVSFDKKDSDFAAANLEKMVRNAADNVKSSVKDFAKNNFEESVSRSAQSATKEDIDNARSELEKAAKDLENESDYVPGVAKKAVNYAKQVLDNIAQNSEKQDAENAKADLDQAAKDVERSYYQSNPAATTFRTAYTGSAPTIQVPVQVETQDGSVNVEQDSDGYTNATIE